MTTVLTDVEFRPLTVPESADAADAGDFLAMVDVRNTIYEEVSGHSDHFMTAAELLPHYQPDAYEKRVMWLVFDAGRPVGRVGLDLPLEGDSRVAYILVELLRAVHGRGIGTAGYKLAERAAREHGRTVLQSWVEHPEAPGARLEPPTGFGSIPAEEPGARFAARHGYTLEQIERCSAYDLSGSAVRLRRLRDAAAAAAADYRTVSWFAPTPAEFVDGYAWMKSRMVTDTPAAAMEFDEEAWDSARIALHDRRYTDADRTLHVVAAQHLATGELCAFNELVIGPDRSGVTHQEDTLVLAAHRGRRLGMLVKTENLLAWSGIAPASPRVMTYNAEENRPMLDINEAIGFTPTAYIGAWKKVLV